MNQKITLKHFVGSAALVCGLAVAPALAQQAPSSEPIPPAAAPSASSAPTAADLNYGLLGQSYSGARFGYDHHIDSPPRVLRRYGFVSNTAYQRGLDTTFNYDYREGSSAGAEYRWHNMGAAFTGYLTDYGAVRPFVTGTVGWRWQRIAGVRENGFAYVAGTGAEIGVARGLAVAPYINYEAAPRLHQHGWFYGASSTYRFNRAWSGLVGAEIDGRHNLAYTLGVNRHF